MTSHLAIYDAQISLLNQTWKLRAMPSAGPIADKLRTDLDSTIAILPDLATQWNQFSEIFCAQKDSINYKFQTLVEDYETAIKSDHVDMTFLSLVISPSWHVVRFLNYYFESWILPAPKLYRLQVNAEIRFRARRFIDKTIEALQIVDSVSPATRYLRTDHAHIPEAAISTVSNLTHNLEHTINKLSGWRSRFSKPETLETLEISLSLVKTIQGHILNFQRLTALYEAYSTRLKNQLRDRRQTLKVSRSFEFSFASVSTTLGPSLHRRDQGNGAESSTFGTKIARLCRDRDDGKIVPPELYMVCLIDILRVTFAEIDDTFIIQRGWSMERSKAIRRYEKQAGSDLDSSIARVP
ncbi:MAG: hypothetical protein Q9184_000735 [Pyrenodesmia sp. 2 TL-2023]